MLTPTKNDWTVREAAHLLNRAGFGGPPKQIKTLHSMGRKKAVDWLLNPPKGTDELNPPEWAIKKSSPEANDLRMKMSELRRKRGEMSAEEAEKKQRELRRQVRKIQREAGAELQGWWFNRMLTANAPLQEKMTLFWHDHFPSSLQKVRDPRFLYRQNALFREFATGNFKDLTQRVALDPAMMIYLDTPQSKKGKPNENFARELLELFTLSEGNYTEQDIKEGARAFTGYTVDRKTGQVRHVKKLWDEGEKTFMGQTGAFNGEDIINIVFEQEACARYVPEKLWEFFAYENPSKELVNTLAETFSTGKFNVKPVLREIFLSEEFYAAETIRNRIKSPVEFLVQMFRQLEIDNVPQRYSTIAEIQLGQLLLAPPNVAGWDWGKAWINTNSLLARYNVAGFVTKGSGGNEPKMRGKNSKKGRNSGKNWPGPDYKKLAPPKLRQDPEKLVQALMNRFFQDDLKPRQQETFEEYAKSKVSENFTDKEVAELVHLMMSTPYYQLS